ncbi:flagellar assembly protein FliW [Deferribacteraceae bacterium V6Fe1]|jgi:flagellar assembly factor FliW|nr:flagellar assembly protein FliW [Deferribacterales bacterium]UOD35254.1 flagellar assembly protein FliW [Deferribacteraceae bacterium V6Fe1]
MSAQKVLKKEENMEKKVLNSPKLGKFEYTEDDLVTMVSPILGFNELSDFLFISSEEFYPFSYFQSVQDENVTFILADIKTFFPDYSPKFNKRDYKVLQIEKDEEMALFGLVVVKDDPQNATINLKAPVVINTNKKLAKQIILEDDIYKVKTPLFSK